MIALLSIAGVLIVGAISVYFILHSYINKINLVDETYLGTKTKEEISAEEEKDSSTPIGDITKDTIEDTTEEFSSEAVEDQEVNSVVNNITETDKLSDLIPKEEQELQSDTPVMNQDSESIKENEDKLQLLEQRIKDNIADNAKILEDKNVTNILFISKDLTASQEDKAYSFVLISMLQEVQKTVSTSFSRDIYVKIPEVGYGTLYQAFAIGGADLLLKSINLNFKVKLDSYIITDSDIVIDLVDEVGGIMLKVKEDEIDRINSNISKINHSLGKSKKQDYLKESGKQLLNGKQVLGYSYLQAATTYDNKDNNSQRMLFQEIFEKIREQNILQMNQLLSKVLPKITTNIKENELLLLVLTAPAYLNYETNVYNIPFIDSYERFAYDNSTILAIDFKKNRKLLSEKIFSIK
jgi:anionic cell wall polymer biosynthesis LytR-Cps2A-Psr (LCP) family protein